MGWDPNFGKDENGLEFVCEYLPAEAGDDAPMCGAPATQLPDDEKHHGVAYLCSEHLDGFRGYSHIAGHAIRPGDNGSPGLSPPPPFTGGILIEKEDLFRLLEMFKGAS